MSSAQRRRGLREGESRRLIAAPLTCFIEAMKHSLLLAALLFAGCASAPAPSNGEPGAVIDGIDVWTGGPPSRPYQVIDTVQSVGPDNSATYADEESIIAGEARERGADAIVVLNTVMVISRQDAILDRPIMAPKVEAEIIKYQ